MVDTFDVVDTATGYACCVACLNDPICGGATFFGAGTVSFFLSLLFF